MSLPVSAPATLGVSPPPEAVVPLTALYPVAGVDLMPPEVAARRRFRRSLRVMIATVLAAVLAAAAAFLVSWQDALAAGEELAAEQSRTTRLQTEAGRYSAVPAVLGTIDRARTSLTVAMGPEVAWYPVLDEISRTAPEPVWFEDITLAAVQPGTPSDNPIATPGAVATVTMTGSGLGHQDVVRWLDAMGGMAAWADPAFSDSTLDDSGSTVSFTSAAVLSSEAYSNRYTGGAVPATPTGLAPDDAAGPAQEGGQ
jgi:hypothetical protein